MIRNHLEEIRATANNYFKTHRVGLDRFDGLKKEAFLRFLKTDDGKRFVFKKIFLLEGKSDYEPCQYIFSGEVVKSLGKSKEDAVAIISIDSYGREYNVVIFKDKAIVSDLHEDFNRRYPSRELPADFWKELHNSKARYLSATGGIEYLKVDIVKGRVSVFDLEKTQMPSWFKKLGIPPKGLIQIITKASQASQQGIPDFKQFHSEDFEVITVKDFLKL